ncbi:MAG: YciI family protein [Gaiellaceae bacterium]|nr:hypothetical protein [Actinomycetota bacterium]
MPEVKTVALVLRGPSWRNDLIMRDQAEIGGHLRLMVRLLHEGVIEAAGPFFMPDEYLEGDALGLVVFALADLATAKRALEDDPARSAGTIAYKVLPWYR